MRGVKHYMQRTALQGAPADALGDRQQWLPRRGQADRATSTRSASASRELEIGYTLKTGEPHRHARGYRAFRRISPATISTPIWTRRRPRANPIFDGRVAHGYLILSFAAGLFVDPASGPVLANYGLDDLRFLKPVNVGDALKVRLTCKQKTLRGDSGYGEVRWDTEVTNQDGEIVAQYDVLTMVATDAHWATVS